MWYFVCWRHGARDDSLRWLFTRMHGLGYWWWCSSTLSWAPLVSPGVNGVLRTWGGPMYRYPLAGGARGEGLLLACAGAVCMGWSDLLCHEASVGIRVGVCLCAHQAVSVMLRVWLLVFPPNRRCRYRGALFAMFPLVLYAGGCVDLKAFSPSILV